MLWFILSSAHSVRSILSHVRVDKCPIQLWFWVLTNFWWKHLVGYLVNSPLCSPANCVCLLFTAKQINPTELCCGPSYTTHKYCGELQILVIIFCRWWFVSLNNPLISSHCCHSFIWPTAIAKISIIAALMSDQLRGRAIKWSVRNVTSAFLFKSSG